MPNKKKQSMHDDPIAEEMGARLRKARKAKGLTQEDVAKMATLTGGISMRQSNIANFENGTRRIRREAALALEKVLNYPAGYFLCVLDEEEAAIIQAVREHRASGRTGRPPSNRK